MTSFYEKLSRFGNLISHTSQTRNVNIANYFTVVHPGYPIVKQTKRTRPKLDFVKGCPRQIRKQVTEIMRMVF